MVVNANPIITVDSLQITYQEYIRDSLFSFGKLKQHCAIEDISFTINHGDKIAVIGKNGSGKSTLLKALAGLLRPSNGFIEVEGRILYLSGSNPGYLKHLSGRSNIRELGSAYGIKKEEFQEFEDEIIKFAELGEDIDRKVANYSSGMMSKLGFGIITALKTDVLLMDESLGAGDREFKLKAMIRLNEFIDKAGAMVICTHSMGNLKRCNRCIVLDEGKLVFDGDIDEGIEFYNQLTHVDINWIDIEYSKKIYDENGININLNDEFQVEGEFRLVIYDKVLQKFTLDMEFDAMEEINIPLDQIPPNRRGRYKFQQLFENQWVDCSRYVTLIEKRKKNV